MLSYSIILAVWIENTLRIAGFATRANQIVEQQNVDDFDDVILTQYRNKFPRQSVSPPISSLFFFPTPGT
jgi:hypothetical protein